MVGHTHEDIDQVFSCVSAHLKKNPVYTLEGECIKLQLECLLYVYLSMDLSIELFSVSKNQVC